jgi:hypothetical protein
MTTDRWNVSHSVAGPFLHTTVDLAKHVGHEVTVKGVAGDTMGGMATFTVKSIKMVGSSCS